jgi:fused signal recognition particle receptor
MFKFLKDKLKDAASKFSKGAEEVTEETKVEEVEKETKEKVSEEVKEEIEEELEESLDGETAEKVAEEVVEESKEEIVEDIPKEPKVEEKPKLSFKEKLKKAVSKKISDKKFEELFEELEFSLLEANVAVEVIDKLKEGLKMEIVDVPIKGKVDEFILKKLKENIMELFKEEVDLVEVIKKSEKPYVIVFLGVNGSGKTTSIAKFAKTLQSNGLSVVLAAADTFRAAAIDQLQLHADKLGVKMIKHDYGSDAAAVGFDAVKHAKTKDVDVVLIDTAGRMHSNANLMDELKKVIRVVEPNFKIFVGESIVGNDCIEQSRKFNDSVGVDGIILSKADVDEKGGTAISISYVVDKPVLFLGTGQSYGDIEKFSVSKLMDSLGF